MSGRQAFFAAPERASDAYVEQIFDAYAASFDAQLEALAYRAPGLRLPGPHCPR